VAKVKCPACGAKNNADDRRCRVCTAVINPDAPQADDRKPVAPEVDAAHDVAASASIQIPGQGGPAAAFAGPPKGESKLSAALEGREDLPDFSAAREYEGPPPALSDEKFEPIEIDRSLQPRPPSADAGPPPPLSDETFDPSSLEIDRTRAPRATGAPPPPVGDDEHFDLDGLVIEDPTDPRPSD
jgi:hypothetical protein